MTWLPASMWWEQLARGVRGDISSTGGNKGDNKPGAPARSRRPRRLCSEPCADGKTPAPRGPRSSHRAGRWEAAAMGPSNQVPATRACRGSEHVRPVKADVHGRDPPPGCRGQWRSLSRVGDVPLAPSRRGLQVISKSQWADSKTFGDRVLIASHPA